MISLSAICHHTDLIIDHLPCTVHFIPVTHLFCNGKFVPLNLPYLFLSSPQLTLLWQHLFVLCIYDSLSVQSCLFICFGFQVPYIGEIIEHVSPSDLFHLRLTPSRSIHVVSNGTISFFLRLIFSVCVCVCTHIEYFLYPFLYWWAFRLFLHLSYCKLSCSEYKCTYTCSNQCFHHFQMNTQECNFLCHIAIIVLIFFFFQGSPYSFP